MLGLGLGLNKLRSSGLSSFLSGAMVWSLNYINKWGETSVELWGLSIKIAEIFTAYVARVTAGGGVVEGEACLGTKLTNLDTIELLDNASLVMIPSGYKSGVVYSQVPTSGAGDLDFTRASTATRINSASLIESVASGVPRLTYSNGSCPSLLVEPQRTNVATDSDGNVSTYTAAALNVTNALSSFNSFSNAIQFPSTGTSAAYKSVVTTAQTYAISVFIKMDDNSVPILTASSTTGNVSLIISGAIATNNLKVESYSNNIYRLSATATSTGLNNNNGVVRFDTQVLKSFKITGIQLEAGTYPTSYIPTVASSVTRLADTALTTFNFGSDFTLFVDFNNNTVGSVNRYIGDFQSSTGGQGTFFIGTNNKFRYLVLYNGAYIAGQNLTVPTTYTVGDRIKGAIVKSGSLYKFFSNGSLIASFNYTAPTTEIINKSYFAQQLANDNSLNLNQFIGYAPLTDSQAIALTTL